MLVLGSIEARQRGRVGTKRHDCPMQVLFETLEPQDVQIGRHSAIDLEPRLQSSRQSTVIRRAMGKSCEVAGACKLLRIGVCEAWYTQVTTAEVMETRNFQVIGIANDRQHHFEILKLPSESRERFGGFAEVLVACSGNSPEPRPKQKGKLVPDSPERDLHLCPRRLIRSPKTMGGLRDRDQPREVTNEKARDRGARRLWHMKEEHLVVEKHVCPRGSCPRPRMMARKCGTMHNIEQRRPPRRGTPAAMALLWRAAAVAKHSCKCELEIAQKNNRPLALSRQSRCRKTGDRATVFTVIASFEAYLFPPSPCRKHHALEINHLQQPVSNFLYIGIYGPIFAEFSTKIAQIAIAYLRASKLVIPGERPTDTVTVYNFHARTRG